VGLKLNWTHQLLTYVDNMILLEDSVDTMKKDGETFIGANRGVGLEINMEKTEYKLLSHHQNAGQNRDIKIVNRLFENVA
jgi:hypothetical protein